MITGFNTDIPHEGVTYHVQTEDKGLETPLILSLVYVGGAIIASKRTPYNDLVASGFNEAALTERLQRQHKLICAAIRAGRVDDLKKMGDAAPGKGPAEKAPPKRAEKGAGRGANGAAREAAKQDAAPPEVPAAPEAAPPAPPESDFVFGEWEPPAAPAARPVEPSPAAEVPAEPAEEGWDTLIPAEVLEAEEFDNELYLNLLEDEGEFRAGQLATIKVQVGRGLYGQRPTPDAAVMIKVLGTSFRPLILSTRTDHEGVAVVRALLPRFTSGRAAIIIRATSGPDAAELRRIIHQY